MGDFARLSLQAGEFYNGELIAVSDSQIVLMSQNSFRTIGLHEIRKIEIPGYSVHVSQRIGAAIPALAMQAFILGVASDIGEQVWVNISAISMVLTVILYATSGSEVEYSAPFSYEDVEQLRLYCRYAQEPDVPVLQQMLNSTD
jgi:hypothetical protein